ncbi:CAP domain-containing protein [Celeribacter neptunius]|uniref:Cysteine-rich secretory protein family protein n=1 Tax=Celeribacter neptunius TaxID=588602 RepID=A0A1I3WJ67_9RHOB|nr:CAP domain-containing protein [Celeribacter neptunius]SFK07400.1 Cysteine-rich secretory protein family protein [Celeribacter neptunius]
MTALRVLMALALGIGIGAGIGAGASEARDLRPLPKATVSIPVSNPQATARDLLSAMNAERRAQGLRKLRLNSALSKAAQAHVDDMIRRNYFAHIAPNGSRPIHRANAAGYKGCMVAENLSYSWKTIDLAMAGWMQSSGHRANLLNREMKDVGIGIGPNNLFVAVFAKPCR